MSEPHDRSVFGQLPRNQLANIDTHLLQGQAVEDLFADAPHGDGLRQGEPLQQGRRRNGKHRLVLVGIERGRRHIFAVVPDQRHIGERFGSVCPRRARSLPHVDDEAAVDDEMALGHPGGQHP